MNNVELTRASVLGVGGFEDRAVSISDGKIVSESQSRQIDLTGFRVFPGLVDVHGDGFERHVAPRRGAMKDVSAGLHAAEAEMAANGITTGVLAQFISWEGGLRGETFATQVFEAIRDLDTITDFVAQLRFETHLLDLYDDLPERMEQWRIRYIVLNDHLPHERLVEGKTPKRYTAQALKAGRNPAKHLEYMHALEARSVEVPAALKDLSARLLAKNIRIGSHDDKTAHQRETWAQIGVHVAEFPETLEAAEAAGLVVLGAPNVVRGGSHNGNVSALDVVLMGHCDALASDYHYPSLRRAALFLAKTIGFPAAWALVSSGPARVLGLTDRGTLDVGQNADLLILDAQDRVAATVCAGRVSYMSGAIVDRFIG